MQRFVDDFVCDKIFPNNICSRNSSGARKGVKIAVIAFRLVLQQAPSFSDGQQLTAWHIFRFCAYFVSHGYWVRILAT